MIIIINKPENISYEKVKNAVFKATKIAYKNRFSIEKMI